MGGLGPLPSFWDLVIQVLNEWVPRKREDKKEAISVKQTSTRCVKTRIHLGPVEVSNLLRCTNHLRVGWKLAPRSIIGYGSFSPNTNDLHCAQ